MQPRVTEADASPAAKEETMTKPKLVFNPVAQDYFDNPYEIYKRMRDEAPIYYDEQEDFYALTRHADVAAAFKDNEAFTPRAIQAQRETVVELVEHYLSKADPDNFDVVQDFSGPFPVEVITRMAGVPEDFRQQVRHWIDKSLHRKPGQIA